MPSLLALAGLAALLCVQSADAAGRYSCYLARAGGSVLDDSTKSCEECALQCISDQSCATMEYDGGAAVTRANLNRDNLSASCAPVVPQLCPPDSAQLGQSVWTSLHTLVSSTPDVLTAAQANAVEAIIASTKTLYPSIFSAVDASGFWEGMPVGASSGSEYANYLCKVHNRFNVALGKEEFNCAAVTTRWNVAGGNPENCIPSSR